MTDEGRVYADSLTVAQLQRIDSVCAKFEAENAGLDRPAIESYLVGFTGVERGELLRTTCTRSRTPRSAVMTPRKPTTPILPPRVIEPPSVPCSTRHEFPNQEPRPRLHPLRLCHLKSAAGSVLTNCTSASAKAAWERSTSLSNTSRFRAKLRSKSSRVISVRRESSNGFNKSGRRWLQWIIRTLHECSMLAQVRPTHRTS